MDRIQFAIVGAGRMGSALAKLLVQQGHQLIEVSSRSMVSARKLANKHGAEAVQIDQLRGMYDWLFITVRDDTIEAVAEQLKFCEQLQSTCIVAHTSGVHSANKLNRLKSVYGCQLLSMHPVGTITHDDSAWKTLKNSFCTLEGDSTAVQQAGRLIDDWGGRWRSIDSDQKPIYHAGAIFASNYLWTVMMAALHLWRKAGLDDQQAKQALISMATMSLADLAQNEDEKEALTGPIRRCDQETIRLHLYHLEKGLNDEEEPGDLIDSLAPEDPIAPEKHRKPEDPVAPEKHRKPEDPIAPEKHRKPEDPIAPEKHRKPEDPIAPEKHRKPEDPIAPEKHSENGEFHWASFYRQMGLATTGLFWETSKLQPPQQEIIAMLQGGCFDEIDNGVFKKEKARWAKNRRRHGL